LLGEIRRPERAVIAMGQAAIKGAFLANSAALIALMAFIANGWKGGIFILPLQGFSSAAVKFVLGLGFALAAQAMSYLSQYRAATSPQDENALAAAAMSLSWTLVGAAYGFFVWGGIALWSVIEKIV